MPIARFQMPDGRIARFEVPEGTTPEQAQAMIAGQAEELTKPKAPAGMQTLANIGGGLIRGAGSIGATLLAPMDMLNDYAFKDRGKTLSSLITGEEKPTRNAERRAAMDGGLQALGVDTDSWAFGGAKLTGEIAGTAAAGPVLAGLGRAAVMRAAPAVLPKVAPALDAVATAGMKAGGVTGKTGLALRTAGGGVTGAAAAGMVNPEDAAMGAGVGAALPGALKVVGAAGGAAGRVLRGAEQSPELASAVTQARGAGYVIPPTQARPTLGNRLLEGFSGKLTTAQNASAKNQSVTNRLAAEALGLPGEAQITPDLLKNMRADAGASYQALKRLGDMTGDARFNNQVSGLKGAFEGAGKDFPGLAKPELSALLDSLKQPKFKASSAVDAVRILRDEADKAFANKDKAMSKALRSAASAMEDLIERNLLRMNAERSLTGILRGGGGVDDIVQAGVNNPAAQMLDEFRKARQLIAKTYTVEKALNPASGSVDARKLAAELKKGKPLSGHLKEAANFGLQFPKAAQTVEGMGSLPQTSPLDWVPAGALSMATSNPLLMMGVGARPAARAVTLSPFIQNRLLQQPSGPGLLQNPDFQQLLLRGSPVAISSGGR